MSGLPGGRDETLGTQSTVENSLLNRLQGGIVDIHEEEAFEEQVLVVVPGPGLHTWTYDGTNHYYQSTGGGQELIVDVGELLPPGTVVKTLFVMQYRPDGSSMVPALQSNGLYAGGVNDDQRTHALFNNADVVDDWELVEAIPRADLDEDPDSPLKTEQQRSVHVVVFSTMSGERVAALKLVIERPRS